MSSPQGDTVIIGAGIIGLSTAYFLSQTGRTAPESIHLIDASDDLFHCASGFAGGFLAADWFAPSNASLGALSYALHKSLAEKYNGRKTWGYGTSTSLSLSHDSDSAVGGSGEDWLESGKSRAEATGAKGAEKERLGPQWLKHVEQASLETISRQGTVAQIDPFRFCQWLLQRCLEKGIKLHQPARASSISTDDKGQLNGIRIREGDVESQLACTRILVASGAWTPRVFSSLFPKTTARIPVSPLAGHSLLVRNPFHNPEESDKEACHAVFATDSLGFSPEWFSRVGGELYLAGLNTTMMTLPETPTQLQPSEEAIARMKECAAEMLGAVHGKPLEVLREALCFRPVSASGRPIVCRVPDSKLGSGVTTLGVGIGGVFIAAGHGAWGISQAPGTGYVMAELMEGRPTSANISALGLPS